MGKKLITYVSFDADNDKRMYTMMKGWDALPTVDFEFHDAHATDSMTYRAESEDYVKKRLRERLKASGIFVLLVGESTRYLYKYVRWEIEIALELGLPIVVAYLDGSRSENEKCPPILRDRGALHIAFRKKALQQALEIWPQYPNRFAGRGSYVITEKTYKHLGLI